MKLSTPNNFNVSVVVDTGQPYKLGDVVSGTVEIEVFSECEVQNIDVVLRCTEYAHTNYFTGFPVLWWNEVFNRHRFYSYRQTLFPASLKKSGTEPSVIWGTRKPKPRNTWCDEFADVAVSLTPGTHTFNFSFTIPDADYPPSMRASPMNQVKWTVGAKVFKCGKLTLTQEAKQLITVYTGSSVVQLPNAVKRVAEERLVTVNPHGENGQEPVELSLQIPESGLLQVPHNAGIKLGLDGEAAADLVISRVELELKRKVVTTVTRYYFIPRRRWPVSHERFKMKTSLYSRNIGALCSEAIESVNEDLTKLRLNDHTETFESKFFNLSYKLVAKVTVHPSDEPSAQQVLKLSVPVKVHSLLADVTHLEYAARYEELPSYQA